MERPIDATSCSHHILLVIVLVLLVVEVQILGVAVVRHRRRPPAQRVARLAPLLLLRLRLLPAAPRLLNVHEEGLNQLDQHAIESSSKVSCCAKNFGAVERAEADRIEQECALHASAPAMTCVMGVAAQQGQARPKHGIMDSASCQGGVPEHAHLVFAQAHALAGDERGVVGPVLVARHAVLLQQRVQHKHLQEQMGPTVSRRFSLSKH